MLANCIFDAEPTLKHVAAAYAHEEQQTKSICGNAKPSRVQQSARDRRRQRWLSEARRNARSRESPDQELTAYVWETKHIKIKTLSSDVFWISVQSHLIGSVVWFGINLEKNTLDVLDQWKFCRAGHGETSRKAKRMCPNKNKTNDKCQDIYQARKMTSTKAAHETTRTSASRNSMRLMMSDYPLQHWSLKQCSYN